MMKTEATKFTREEIKIIHRAMGIIMAASTHDLGDRKFYEDLNSKLLDITFKMNENMEVGQYD